MIKFDIYIYTLFSKHLSFSYIFLELKINITNSFPECCLPFPQCRLGVLYRAPQRTLIRSRYWVGVAVRNRREAGPRQATRRPAADIIGLRAYLWHHNEVCNDYISSSLVLDTSLFTATQMIKGNKSYR